MSLVWVHSLRPDRPSRWRKEETLMGLLFEILHRLTQDQFPIEENNNSHISF